MPIRTASLNNQIQKTGVRLHLAMMSRVHSQGADHAASEEEQALMDEHRLLKEAQAKRRVLAKLPKPKAAASEKKAKPPKAPKAPKAAKEPKEPKEPKSAKLAKDHLSRSEKHAKKAESLEAAKRAAKKSAKT